MSLKFKNNATRLRKVDKRLNQLFGENRYVSYLAFPLPLGMRNTFGDNSSVKRFLVELLEKLQGGEVHYPKVDSTTTFSYYQAAYIQDELLKILSAVSNRADSTPLTTKDFDRVFNFFYAAYCEILNDPLFKKLETLNLEVSLLGNSQLRAGLCTRDTSLDNTIARQSSMYNYANQFRVTSHRFTGTDGSMWNEIVSFTGNFISSSTHPATYTPYFQQRSRQFAEIRPLLFKRIDRNKFEKEILAEIFSFFVAGKGTLSNEQFEIARFLNPDFSILYTLPELLDPRKHESRKVLQRVSALISQPAAEIRFLSFEKRFANVINSVREEFEEKLANGQGFSLLFPESKTLNAKWQEKFNKLGLSEKRKALSNVFTDLVLKTVGFSSFEVTFDNYAKKEEEAKQKLEQIRFNPALPYSFTFIEDIVNPEDIAGDIISAEEQAEIDADLRYFGVTSENVNPDAIISDIQEESSSADLEEVEFEEDEFEDIDFEEDQRVEEPPAQPVQDLQRAAQEYIQQELLGRQASRVNPLVEQLAQNFRYSVAVDPISPTPGAGLMEQIAPGAMSPQSFSDEESSLPESTN